MTSEKNKNTIMFSPAVSHHNQDLFMLRRNGKQEAELSLTDRASVAHYTGFKENKLSAVGQYRMQ